MTRTLVTTLCVVTGFLALGVSPATASLAVIATETGAPTPTPITPEFQVVSPQVDAPAPGLLPHPKALATLVARSFSPPANPIVIGYSVAGRPLEVYRFGSGDRFRRLIVAGIHGGNEWNTIALADELIEHLAAKPQTVPTDTTLYILRALNPDGAARGDTVDGRVNAHGVDLNRNWPEAWQHDWPRAGCWIFRRTTGGWRPASEPETIALMQFILAERVDALISYHSAALGIFPAGDPPDPASAKLAESIAAVIDYPYPPVDTGCLYTGTLPDWAAANGVAAVDVELSDHVHTEFYENLAVLAVLLKWQR
jgi:predicted deacylase